MINVVCSSVGWFGSIVFGQVDIIIYNNSHLNWLIISHKEDDI